MPARRRICVQSQWQQPMDYFLESPHPVTSSAPHSVTCNKALLCYQLKAIITLSPTVPLSETAHGTPPALRRAPRSPGNRLAATLRQRVRDEDGADGDRQAVQF